MGGKELRKLTREVAAGSQLVAQAQAQASRDAKRREAIASRIMAGFAAAPEDSLPDADDDGNEMGIGGLAKLAVRWADALIEALDDRALEDAVSARDLDIDAGDA